MSQVYRRNLSWSLGYQSHSVSPRRTHSMSRLKRHKAHRSPHGGGACEGVQVIKLVGVAEFEVVSMSGPTGRIPGRPTSTRPKRRWGMPPPPLSNGPQHRQGGKVRQMPHPYGGGGGRTPAWKRAVPPAFGLYMAGGIVR